MATLTEPFTGRTLYRRCRECEQEYGDCVCCNDCTHHPCECECSACEYPPDECECPIGSDECKPPLKSNLAGHTDNANPSVRKADITLFVMLGCTLPLNPSP